MRELDSSLFLDVADALGISSPAIVEKDYWATQLLKEISEIRIAGARLVFSGGTCLSKAHQNTFRMSEDIDMKIVLDQSACGQSKSQQKKILQWLHQQILDLIAGSDVFALVKAPKKLNESKYQQFLIEYPRAQNEIAALRPHLQLELTQSELLENTLEMPLSSLYAKALKRDEEVRSMECVSISSIAAEKFVALLRRTALSRRDDSRADDETLIRHLYDLHVIYSEAEPATQCKDLVKQVIKTDRRNFGNRHADFALDPIAELRVGLSLLTTDERHQRRYNQFIGPLIYDAAPASWNTAIETVQKLAARWI